MSRSHFTIITLAAIALFCGCQPEQKVPDTDRAIIEQQIEAEFSENVDAAERIDLLTLRACVDDRFKTGFIQAGTFYPTFDSLADTILPSLKILKDQKIEIAEKRITVLAPDIVLLTTHGRYVATPKLVGIPLTGEFAWTFVYAKINDRWKIIHSHQSTPTTQ